MISSYVGENGKFEQMLSGELEVDLIPQGSLKGDEGRNSCIFYTCRFWNGNAKGKEVRRFNGKPHILELALTADYSL